MRKLYIVAIFLFIAGVSSAQEGVTYRQYFDQIQKSGLDITTTATLSDFTLEHNSIKINFTSGQIAFFEPLIMDSDTIYYAAYFKGEGNLFYQPPVNMEKEQLRRFIGRDSVDNKFEEMLLLFEQQTYLQLKSHLEKSDLQFSNGEINKAARMYQFEDDLSQTYHFMLFKSLINFMPDPFLALLVKPAKMDWVIYCYNPFEREEVSLLLKNNDNYKGYMETVNSYSKFNNSEDYKGLNGLSKDQIQIIDYNIAGDVDRRGIFSCTTLVRFETKIGPLRLLEFNLMPSLKISSIIDENGAAVPFERYDLDISFHDYKSYQVDLFLNQPLNYGDTTELTFIYKGEIAERSLNEFFVFAGSDWYPRYGYRQLATYSMKFLTPEDFAFIVTGQKINESKLRDKKATQWKVSTPSANISFNLGNMEKYLFEEADIVPLEVYFSKELHNDITRLLTENMIAVGRNMQDNVAIDVQNSLRVYNYFFGQQPYDRIRVSEVLSNSSTSYPGYIHLGFDTWINDDPYGADLLLRAHEVSHQWWGVGVGYETYHDQWLSEGFATYSSLLAYQMIEKDKDKFLNKLKDYRNEIFSVRKYLLGSGEESGPIALGYRTSSSKTKGDKSLIIYKKGALVLHMIRNLLIDFNTMNEDNFRYLLQDFYQLYRGKEATTAQFQALVEKYTGIEMDWFFRQWVYRNELPTYEFTYSYDTDSTGAEIVKGQIVTKNVADDFKMFVPLEIQFAGDKKAYIRLLVDQPVFNFTLPGLAERPRRLVLNPFESVLAKVKQ